MTLVLAVRRRWPRRARGRAPLPARPGLRLRAAERALQLSFAIRAWVRSERSTALPALAWARPPRVSLHGGPTVQHVNVLVNLGLAAAERARVLRAAPPLERVPRASTADGAAERVTHRLVSYLEEFRRRERSVAFRSESTTTFVNRILRRTRRVDMTETVVRRSRSTVEAASAPARVPGPRAGLDAGVPERVFRGPQIALEATRLASAPSRAAHRAPLLREGRVRFDPPNEPRGSTPVDVDRLADRVIRALEQRMLALRERMGRV